MTTDHSTSPSGPHGYPPTQPLSVLESCPSSGAFAVARNTESSVASSRSFGDFSEFLRASVADEESLQMGESLQGLSAQIESIADAWRSRDPDGSWLAPDLLALMEALREHHGMLLDLNRDWDRFLEFKAHLAALNQFRANVAQCVGFVHSSDEPPPSFSEFDVSAWRMLGAGALLLDVYEQSGKSQTTAQAAPSSAWSRLVGWIRNAG